MYRDARGLWAPCEIKIVLIIIELSASDRSVHAFSRKIADVRMVVAAVSGTAMDDNGVKDIASLRAYNMREDSGIMGVSGNLNQF